MMRWLICVLLLSVQWTMTYANGVTVSNIRLRFPNVKSGSNNTANHVKIECDLTWNNSWRNATNWDAVWVFAKYRVGNADMVVSGASSSGATVTVASTANLRVGMPVLKVGGTGTLAANTTIASIVSATQFTVSPTPTGALSGATLQCLRIWEHAYLNNTGHTAPSGSSIAAGLVNHTSAFNSSTNPAVGVFVYRSEEGSGTATFNDLRLRWNYGANTVRDTQYVDVRVYAIEMVYVPPGPFFVGGGASDQGGFKDGSSSDPFYITAAWNSTNASGGRKIGNTVGQLWGYSTGGNNSIGVASTTTPLNDAYPTGFDGFYCMKYELSQGMFRDFMNTLTYRQQTVVSTRVTEAPGTQMHSGYAVSNRLTIEIVSSGNAGLQLPAMYGNDASGNNVSNDTNDGEWVGMNGIYWPDMSAFLDWSGLRPMTELEFEKACRGDQVPVTDEYAWGTTTLTSALFANVTNANQATEGNSTANGNCLTNSNTQRGGLFAAVATTRVQSGAGYYGCMELSGNLFEICVSIGLAGGRSYTGIHGDGRLTAAGAADVTAWPGGNTGMGVRGGGHRDNFNVSQRARVADRAYMTGYISLGSSRYDHVGIRGVRSIPQ